MNAALAAFQARDRDTAAALLAEAVRTRADFGPKWGAIARLAMTIGSISDALTATEQHARVNPADPGPRLAHGEMLAQCGRNAEACAVGLALTREQPRNPTAWHFLGTCLAQAGETEASITALRRAMSLHTDPAPMAASWHALVESKTFSVDDPDLQAMSDLMGRLPQGETGIEARSTLLYALGKAYDDLGDTKRAFSAYSDGAAIMKARRGYSAAATDAFVEQIIQGWTTNFASRLPAASLRTRRPIFVFGLPRSGTTLIEQILVSHDDVIDGGEINRFSTAAMGIKGFTPDLVATFAGARGSEGFDAIGRAYLGMIDELFGPTGRIVDKTLNHSRYLGLIRHVLPDARFIWLSRSPGGVAWSCFRTRFARGVDWSWSLDDMGRYFRGEDRLREHWTEQFGDAVLTVPYDELVGDIEPWITRILDHVGLPPQAGLSEFHKTKRAVTTASFAQVRKPLYTSSREAWRRYETELAPFFDAYQG
ncbi:MAG: tetratricopeptide repeat-containing sulfotransferase family protein [Brevundimonas sp.]